MTRALSLDKIVIIYDANKNTKASSKTGVNEVEHEQDFIKNVFFRIYVGSDETAVYDQLIERTKKDMPVGETIVSIDATVSGDFYIKCFRQG